MLYIQRDIEKSVLEYLTLFPAVGLTGPRQSGKSTLLQHVMKDYDYVTFDNFTTQDHFQNDPDGFMQQYSSKVIFDEVQKMPDIFNYIKIRIDENRDEYGQCILTGSSQFTFIKKLNESLAGRIGLLSMLPLCYSEMPDDNKYSSIYQGAYPELVKRHYRGKEAWYASYIDTYLTKDVRDLIHIADLRDFQRLIRLLASRVTQVLNMSEFSKELGVTVQTIKRWISVLEASYVIFLLPPFYKNFGKRITKTPKLYFYDTGLISHLTGIETQKQYEQGPMSGQIFENYIISEIIKNEYNRASHAEFYYFRTSNGMEIDLIVKRKTKYDFIEIKKTATFRAKMVQHLEQIQENNMRRLLLYSGKPMLYQHTEIMPFQQYLSEKPTDDSQNFL